MLPSTVERVLRPLRSEGMVPMGEKGRGQHRGHYEPEHLANVLAFASTQPSEGAEIARLLGSMVHGLPIQQSASKLFPAGTTLHAALARIIAKTGEWLLSYDSSGASADTFVPPTPEFAPHILAAVRVRLNSPRSGEISWWADGDNEYRIDYFIPPKSYTVTGDLHREVILGRLLIWGACHLWADTLHRRNIASNTKAH